MANQFFKEWQNIAVLYGGGKPIVFTNGCFDIFHAGHVELLETIRFRYPQHVVIVGLNSDASVRRLKGCSRPVNTLEQRRKVLEACRYVDEVVAFDEDTPLELIKHIHPAVIMKDSRYRGKFVAGANYIRRHGGRVDFVDPLKGVSTTGIIARAKKGRGR